MAKMGRPTDDPKTLRVTVRLTDRDLEALSKVARQRRDSLAGALRLVMREALGVPACGLIASARPVIRSIVDAGLYYDDAAIRTLLSSIDESWP